MLTTHQEIDHGTPRPHEQGTLEEALLEDSRSGPPEKHHAGQRSQRRHARWNPALALTAGHCNCTWLGWDHTPGVVHSRFCEVLMYY